MTIFSSYCYFLSRQFSCFCLCFFYTTFSMIHPISHGACALLRQSSNPAITELLIMVSRIYYKTRAFALILDDWIHLDLLSSPESFIHQSIFIVAFLFQDCRGAGTYSTQWVSSLGQSWCKNNSLFFPLTLPLYHLHYFILFFTCFFDIMKNDSKDLVCCKHFYR